MENVVGLSTAAEKLMKMLENVVNKPVLNQWGSMEGGTHHLRGLLREITPVLRTAQISKNRNKLHRNISKKIAELDRLSDLMEDRIKSGDKVSSDFVYKVTLLSGEIKIALESIGVQVRNSIILN